MFFHPFLDLTHPLLFLSPYFFFEKSQIFLFQLQTFLPSYFLINILEIPPSDIPLFIGFKHSGILNRPAI